MRLTTDRFQRLQRSLELALNQEWPKLGAIQRKLLNAVAQPILPLRKSNLNAVATVATDGGENKLSLEPMRLQVIRVADSLGEIYFEEFIAESLGPEEIFRFYFKSQERLQRFMQYLDLEWSELLPETDLQRSHLVSMMRELMEWAALLKLASQPGAKLLIRDGLLRSVLLPERVFHRLRSKFELLTRKHGHLLVGVAKHSRALSYLSAALDLAEKFSDDQPSFLRVLPELEIEAAPTQYRWIGSRAMGALAIARLDFGQSSPLLPIDLAPWQQARADEAMSLLRQCSRASFPVRGYPQPLIDAHEHARLGGLEVEMIEELLLQRIRERDPATAEVARQFRLTGQRFAQTAAKPTDDEA